MNSEVKNKIEKIITDWKTEADISNTIAYDMNISDKRIIIYTDRPSLMIGYHGALVNKYMDIITKEFSYDDNKYTCKFVEIRNGSFL